MKLSLVQEQAITARIALVVGAEEFDRLFLGIAFSEVEGDILFAHAYDDDCAAEIEDKYSEHLATLASGILGRKIGIVMVLPKVTSH
jgi:hypothetical protein